MESSTETILNIRRRFIIYGTSIPQNLLSEKVFPSDELRTDFTDWINRIDWVNQVVG